MMKKWKLMAAMGLLALSLTSCKGNQPAQETTVKEAQTAGDAADKADDAAGAEEQGDTEETPAADAEEIKSSNPMQDVSGPEDLAEIGVSMELPEAAGEVQCFIISQVVAEANFTLDGTVYAYRGSATAEDFAGIFEEFEEEVSTIPSSEDMDVEGDLTIKTTKSGGKLASWSKNGAGYTLYTASSVEEEVLVDLCRELIEKN